MFIFLYFSFRFNYFYTFGMNQSFPKYFKLVRRPKNIFNKVPFKISFQRYLEFLDFKFKKDFAKSFLLLIQFNLNLYSSNLKFKKKKNFFSVSKINLWFFYQEYFKSLKRGEKKFFYYLFYKKIKFLFNFLKKNYWQRKKFYDLTRYMLLKKFIFFFGKKKVFFFFIKTFFIKSRVFLKKKNYTYSSIKYFFSILKYIKLRRFLFQKGKQSHNRFEFVRNLLSLSFLKNTSYEKKYFLNLKLIVTLNNFFVIISNEHDFILFKISGGFYEKGSRKRNDLTLETSLTEEEEGALEFLIDLKKRFPYYKYIKFFYSCPRSKYFFKTLLYNFRQVNRDLNLKIIEVKNIAPLAHNGCRRKKKRRV